MKEYIEEFRERLGLDDVMIKRRSLATTSSNLVTEEIERNINFHYRVIFSDSNRRGAPVKKGLLLFHGLNERSWDKYYPWADFLSARTGCPVVLFPFSMHIDRAPLVWSDPRNMQQEVYREKSRYLSFVNYAISARLKADPYRFYLGGRETLYNIWQFISDVRSGRCMLFDRSCTFNVFAYSIGALLSQVLLMGDHNGFFERSKLFMFCGGSFFSEMNGRSKMIMDEDAFEALQRYYKNDFLNDYQGRRLYGDAAEQAFVAHIAYGLNFREREIFYEENYSRIKAISLKNDRVVPTSGIIHALGRRHENILEEIDFPFAYTHESPFPNYGKGDYEDVNSCFSNVFSRAADFLKE